MCGIIALLLADKQSHANQLLYDGLTVLQHRGQDAAGIMTAHQGRLRLRKDNGLVKDVFQQQHMQNLRGNMGIGHCRYPTAGSSSSAESQPFYTNSPYGIALAHNGNLTNSMELISAMADNNFRHINTDSDSELLLNVFADELLKQDLPLGPRCIFKAVAGLHRRCRGGYSAVVLINGYGIVAFRDPHGIRPCVFGTRESKYGTDYVIASESVAVDALEFTLNRDVAPGEAIFIQHGGLFSSEQCAEQSSLQPCIFEYVYFARPDSVIDGVSVYQARLEMGKKLADRILADFPYHDIDVVIPIPDTSRTSALQVANRLNLPYREAFVKNRYIARTFIMNGQVTRKKTVKLKLNAIRSEFQDKKVLLIDDSIVRGTTARQIVQFAREAGAKKVYFASAAPAIRHPNVYGVDMPTREELVAHNRSVKEIATEIGADLIFYQDLKDLEDAVRAVNPSISSFDSSCFNGKYVTGDIDDEYLERLRLIRSDSALAEKNQPYSRTFSDPLSDDILDIHNE